MIKIPVGHGYFALIDQTDIDLLFNYSWSLNGHGYPHAKIKGKMLRLHRIIGIRKGLSKDKEFDHKDLNPLNCLRENIREATPTQNSQNRSTRSDNRLGLKGVRLERNGKYQARINMDGIARSLGYYNTPEEAKAKYDLVSRQIFGEFARSK